ncbi:MAG: RHS repeat-associated core domain-containing protein, partial [Pirellulales bacterium]|nr:RHS repeat-associated core domain-containing protein [Pirellulales bacterium]
RTHKISGSSIDYTWDHRNRLINVEPFDSAGNPIGQGLAYRYNADDQLVYRHRQELGIGPFLDPFDEHHYVYDRVDRVLSYDGETDSLAHRYVPGLLTDQVLFDEVFNEFGQQDELLALAADHSQTTRAVLNELGDIVQAIDYDSFGEVSELRDAAGNRQEIFVFGMIGGIPDTSQLASDVAHAGRFWDDDVQLYQNRARWYDPTIGRFISEDPIQEDNNWYRYAGNDPVNFVDPTGLSLAAHPLSNFSSDFGASRFDNPALFGSLIWCVVYQPIFENDMLYERGAQENRLLRQ